MNNQGTIHALFEDQVKKNPDHLAIIADRESLSYHRLNEKANQLAHYLQRLNLDFDTPIAVCMERSEVFLVSILAILKIGCAWLPIDLAHPAERLLFILQDAASPVLITHSGLGKNFGEYRGHLLCVDTEAAKIDQYPRHNPDLSIASSNLAYVIYTSGSTGTPKGVLIEHASVINYGLWFAQCCASQPQQRIDFSANPNFDMAITVSILPLMLGQSLVICPEPVKKDLRLYLHYLNTQRIEMIKLTPSYFKVLLMEIKNNNSALPHLKSIILGGEQLMTAECQAWLELYPDHLLVNEYGPTETTVGISIYKIDQNNIQNRETNIPIGYCAKNCYCHILDADKNPVTEGESGELYIGGTCLARGYLNRPELTRERFIPDPFGNDPSARLYKTGDLCRRLDNGLLEYLGRMDNQVKIRGYRIELEEIEKYLGQHPAIETLALLTQKDLAGENRLIAYFIPREGQPTPGRQELIDFLRPHLPEFMIPEGFFEIDALPLTPNGKLDKDALPLPEFTTSQDFIEPQSALEKAIAGIWSKELRLQKIGLNDDFFELGGHSLSAARILSEINARFKKNIAMQDFYQASSIAKFIPLLESQENAADDIPNLPVSDEKDIPLSEFQFMLWMMNTFEPETRKLNITARKRFKGRLNTQALTFALDAVIKKQEVLAYQILKFRPGQHLKKQALFDFKEENLSGLSEEKSEEILETSMLQLIDFYPWPKDSPLFFARLFYLDKDISELQISMSHMISDDISPDILFADLSQYYLSYAHSPQNIAPDPLYKHYIQEEQSYYQKNFERDSQFWKNYLEDTRLFSFPAEHIVEDMHAEQTGYSTWSEIPEESLVKLKQFCARHHISLNDGLCAAMAFVLSKYSSAEDQTVFVNRVKSTRENRHYDDTIGCFLRLEPVKIRMNKKAALSQFSAQIHQASVETSPYQRCPGLVKLTATKNFQKKHSKIGKFLINLGSYLYASLFNIPVSQRKIINQCSLPLMFFERNNHYLININVHSNFLEASSAKPVLFGLESMHVSHPQYDLLNIDNCLDVCFMRNNAENKPWLVISANLQPDFRELIAKELIHTFEESMSVA